MNTIKDEINRIKKAALHFDLIEKETDITPKLDTYFGGKPYLTNEKEIHVCPKCKMDMEFIFQIFMPDKKTGVKKMYSFYYCFECVENEGEGTYAMNIYTNPTEERMLETEYESVVPYTDVKFLPAYEIPEFNYTEEAYPEFVRKIESLYGDRAFEAYEQIEQRVREYFSDTGFKIKGYPVYIDYDDIPVCPRTGVKMEPFIQMENVPELNLDWLENDSYLILFKSPQYDEFTLRTIDLVEYDEGLIEDDVFEDASDDDLLDI